MKALALLGVSLFLFSSANAGLYRWVDDAGEVHFSDKVPVAASKKTHSVMDKHGLTTKVIDPEAVQREEDNKNALALETEQKKQSLLEEKLKNADARKRDKQLLLTYEDEAELSRYFENKIKLVKGNSDILVSHNALLAKRLEKLEKQKSQVKNERIKKALSFKIVDINKTIEQYEKALKDNNLEMLKLSESYKKDHERFTELTKKN